MSDLERLLDGDADPIERSLLEAAKDEDDERARTERTLAALGLGGPGPGPAPGDGGGAGGATAGGAVSGGMALKWLAVVAVGGAVAVAVVARRGESPPPVATAPLVVATHEEPAPVATPAPSAPATAAPLPSASAAVPVPRRIPSAPSVTGAPPPPKAAGTSDLKREIAALDRARSALRDGDAARAKKELDRYDYEFPFGSLAPEAAALRARLKKMSGPTKKP